MRPWRVLPVLFLALVLAGCGWQLRGSGGAGLEGRAVAVTAPNDLSAVRRAAERELTALGGRSVDEAVAQQVLALLAEQTPRRALAEDDRGRAVEYELTYRLTYRVLGGDGEPRAAQASATAQGTYRADGDDALAEQARRERLTAELRAEAIRLMLSRLAALEPEGNG
ncbi:LPS-assembly lipoprotein LptE [Arhodomonas sp. SL1]|uniref:LPS-assembly lipoprotein LptE n=1 Tax=Arhodomonas sp. SL1 TaxID=3425691 RepID=UPI003F885D3A